jgi:signal transduction histidine kinase
MLTYHRVLMIGLLLSVMAADSGFELVETFLMTMVTESRVKTAEMYLADDADIIINGVEYSHEEYFDRLETQDRQFDVLDVSIGAVLEQGDRVALKHELVMEHRGTAFGVQPQNGRFKESSASFMEAADGTIQSLDVTYDPTASLEELGLLSTDPTTEKLRDQYYEILNRVLRHNLRNRLNIILTAAESMPDNPDAATTIEEHTNGLLDTVEKARKIEQMAIDSPLDPTQFDVEDSIDEVVERFERHHDLQCRCDCPETPLELTSDKRLFQNVLEETLENAILYSDADIPKVVITASPATDERYGLQLTIEDNGPGIPENELEPLRQDRETQVLHGSGIGLWIVKWCVTRLEGQLEFDSDNSTVHITLPNIER